MSLPILIDTPHSSGHAPFYVLAEMLCEDVFDNDIRQERLNHLFKQGDPLTDEIFFIPEAQIVNANISRFVVDLNRMRDTGGLNGVIKVTDFDAKSLYCDGFEFTKEILEERLARYYDPYHATLDRAIANNQISYFISGHAMSPDGPLIGPDCGTKRPALSFITNGLANGEPKSAKEHTSVPASVAQAMAEIIYKHFKDIIKASDVPDEVLINDPFNNAGIAKRLSDPKNPNAIPGFGLELNQNLYLEQNTAVVVPIKNRVKELNLRMQAFMLEIIPLFEELKQNSKASPSSNQGLAAKQSK